MNPRVLFSVVMLLLRLSVVAQSLPGLIPYTNGEKWGYADTNGNVVIEPRWKRVYFFQNDKAEVHVEVRKNNSSSTVNALIDKQGQYIIPPSRYWRGHYSGWTDDLNALDERGNKILIDTNNKLVIGPDWSPGEVELPEGEYRIFTVGRLKGIMRSDFVVTVPPLYEELRYFSEIDGIPVYKVLDTLPHTGYLKYGILSAKNEMILPFEYSIINSYTKDSSGLIFSVSKYTQRFKQEAFKVNVNTGEEIKVDEKRDQYRRVECKNIQTKHCYIYRKCNSLDRSAILSLSNDVLIPGGVTAVTDDTVYVEQVTRNGDSLITINMYRDAATLEHFVQPDTVIYSANGLSTPQAPPFICGNQSQRTGNSFFNRSKVYFKGKRVSAFYKDSLYIYVDKGLPDWTFEQIRMYPTFRDEMPKKHAFSAKGSVPGDKRNPAYNLVVTDSAELFVKPFKGYATVTSFNPNDTLATVRNNFVHYNYSIYNAEGVPVTPTSQMEIKDAIRWENRMYVFVKERTDKYFNKADYRWELFEVVRITDSNLNIMQATCNFNVRGKFYVGGEFKGLIVRNNMRRVGVVTPDGRDYYPELNFKYLELTVINDENLFLCGSDFGNLRNAADQPYLPDIKIEQLHPMSGFAPYTLYQVHGVDKEGDKVFAFLDKYGRIYYK